MFVAEVGDVGHGAEILANELAKGTCAGLYRYVTDHMVCIQETQMDKILFTIY